MTLTHVEHGFGPVWDAGSRVLVLGSMPSPKSRDAGFYYMHRFNRFWPVMAAIFDDDSCLPPEGGRWPSTPVEIAALTDARRTFALEHHVALWDVIASCDIAGASDATIRNAAPNDIPSIVRGSAIARVFTTGAKAAQLYRRLCQPLMDAAGLGDIPVTPLPSTSSANAGMSLERLIEAYQPIAQAAGADGANKVNESMSQ
ncbi:uracil-DNA glycosylase family protein [Bifidobacterium avesanii]|uniref:DNA-deoxyinosine glycosylase n=1 Tax=Bifidobacterium avesanii TaxID=1798157 RepID=A0A7K3TJG6_9BIFI|nr:uracil-DNA glycosylase family protein [Bifidobacterium avesanii]KAB8290993.1 G:T/U mismatch-specific DNA glycosylase [Bifidobacterium avesanii]NEG78760.1 DNA-deoxyinosine glycosylase [Bifidobacterium avesanii]